jgi:FK506-binding protein 1
MVRLAVALFAAAAIAHPVHPEGQYYVDEPEQLIPKGKVSTKWPTEEEKQLRRAQKAKAAKAVAFKMGRPVDMKEGTEVQLSDGGFGLTVLKAGDGHNFPSRGDHLTMHYTGKLKDGTVFDSSRERNQPFTFTVGVGEVITGWDQGIVTMSLGERAMLHVPSYKGYGSSGAGAIPPNSDLEFDVELLAINGRAEPGFVMPTEAPAKSGSERAVAFCLGTAFAVAAQVLV